ncbi:MAG: BrnT family toxin [Deltaproteobacteria bacterium]|nr:BrnT family toxin [Deltaproteobacteria bacterium]
MKIPDFEWDDQKNNENVTKHGISFYEAQYAFKDPKRVIAEDLGHSGKEKRYYCFGSVSNGILTVRFTHRSNKIRIFGAGYWRKGKALYEKENKLHK